MLEVSYLSTNTEQRVTISYIEVTLNIVWSITSITELLLNYNYVSFISIGQNEDILVNVFGNGFKMKIPLDKRKSWYDSIGKIIIN